MRQLSRRRGLRTLHRRLLSTVASGGGGGGSADPHIANVKLLIGGDLFVQDESSPNRPMTANLVTKTLTNTKFGNGALNFPGSGNYINFPTSDDWNLSGDFTIEAWVRVAAVNANYTILSCYSIGGARAWMFTLDADGNISFCPGDGGLIASTKAAHGLAVNTYAHVAVTRSGNDFRLFVGGQMKIKETRALTIPSGAGLPLAVGATDGFNYFAGQMDEVRLTKGVARYVSDAGFTPPDAAFPRPTLPASTNTLYHFENGTISPAFTNADAWFVVNDADAGGGTAKALASKVIPHGGTTSMFLNNVLGGEVTIRAKVQSEGGYDLFKIFQNGVQQYVASSVQTTYSEYRLLLSAGGTDDIEFRYSKDGGVASGTDDVRISKITVAPELPTPPAAPSGGWRYFMIETRTTDGFQSALSCNTLKLLTAGGVDEALQANGGTATAVGWTPSGPQPITNVNDGNDATYVQGIGGGGLDKGIMIDTGAPTPGIVKMGFKAAIGSETPRTGTIRAKVNVGDAWTTLKYLNEPAWSAGEYREWTIG